MMPEELQIITLAKNGEYESFIHELEKMTDDEYGDLSKKEAISLTFYLQKAYLEIEKKPRKDTLMMIVSKVVSLGDERTFQSLKSFALEKLSYGDAIEFLVESWGKLIGNGFVGESDRVAATAMDYILHLKRYEAGIAFCEEVLEERGDYKGVQQYYPKFLILKGDSERIESYFENVWTNLLKGKDLKRGEALRAFAHTYSHLTSKRKKNIKNDSVIVSSLINCFRNGDRNPSMRKMLVNKAYDMLLSGKDKYLTLLSLFLYDLEFSKKRMGTNLLLYLESQQTGIRPWQRKVINNFSKKLEDIEDTEQEVAEEDFDLGQDLLEEESKGAKGFTQIRHLERDIQFLKELGDEQGALEKMQELKSVDPENDLIKDLHEMESSEHGTRVFQKNRDTEKVIRDLIDEIDRYASEGADKSDSTERHLETAVKMIPDTEFLMKGQDLYVSAYQMEFFSLATSITSRALSLLKDEDTKDRIVYRYLMAEALIAEGYYHKALDICREDLQSSPLMKSERVDFLYLSGECLMKIGNKAEAYSVFKKIGETSPGYRLVKQRLEKLEKYQ